MLKRLGFILVLLEALLEVEALVFLVKDFEIGPFWRVFLPLSAHGMALGLLALGFLHVWNRKSLQDRAWMAVGLCLTMPLPLLGFLGFVALYAASAVGLRSTGDLLRDFEAYITHDKDLVEAARLREAEMNRFVMEQVDVAPLRAILRGTDIPHKRGAILSLATLPKPEAVELLKQSLTDESREIRYYSSTALSEMERDFNDRIFKLVREVERSPTSVDRHIDLACMVLDYAETDLLDEIMVGYFVDIGLTALDKARIVASDDPRIRLYAGLLHRRAGRLEKAEEALAEYLSMRPENADATMAMAEVAFEIGNRDLARDVIGQALARFQDDRRFQDLARVIGASTGGENS